MQLTIRRVALGLVLIFGGALPSAAQSISAGYQFQRLGGENGLNMPAGFNVDAAIPFGSDNLSVVGQVDWSRRTESGIAGVPIEGSTTLTSFGGGIRWGRADAGGATPFVQGLIGVMRNKESCKIADVELCGDVSGSNLLMQLGAGVSVPMSDRLSFVGQADYRRIAAESVDIEGFEIEGGGTNAFRIVAGIRFSL